MCVLTPDLCCRVLFDSAAAVLDFSPCLVYADIMQIIGNMIWFVVILLMVASMIGSG